MDHDEFTRNFGDFVDRHIAASGKIDTMDVNFKNELHQIEQEINYCKQTLQSYCNEYKTIETGICEVKQLQGKARFVLNNVRSKEEDLQERFKNLSFNYEAYEEKSGYKDPDETIRVKINELAMHRKNLIEELVQLKRRADDNDKKLARAKAMIAEQENKNAMQIRKLKEISENAVFVSPGVKERIDTILRQQEIDESDSY